MPRTSFLGHGTLKIELGRGTHEIGEIEFGRGTREMREHLAPEAPTAEAD